MAKQSLLSATSSLRVTQFTNGDDIFSGTLRNDRISLLGGNDFAQGNDGNDLIYGGDGNDSLFGGAGQNTLYGGNGDDRISANAQFEFSVGGPALIYGDAGNDVIFGGLGNDTIFGGADNDYIEDYSGLSRIDAGTGNDTIFANDGTLIAGAGNDLVYGGAGIVTGGLGDDILHGSNLSGGAGMDQVWGDAVASRLKGGAGMDALLAASVGNDTMTGGADQDSFYFLATDRGVDVVTDFDVTQDILNFMDFNVTDPYFWSTQVGADTHITIDQGNGTLTVILQNVTATDLQLF